MLIINGLEPVFISIPRSPFVLAAMQAMAQKEPVAELSPGATVSHYRIVGKIGAGGMGEVYSAHDTDLGRQVALKFLSGEVALQKSRVKRFIQEAQAASALNHPNILTVHQIGRDYESIFIATEFVDGATLRRHMRKGLKLIEVLDIAIQIRPHSLPPTPPASFIATSSQRTSWSVRTVS